MKRFIFLICFSVPILLNGQVITIPGNNVGAVNTDKELITQDKTYDETTGSNQFTLLNPAWAHRTSIEHIIDETNLDTDSVYYVFYMDTYQYFTLHYNISGGATITVYVTNDATADDEDETSGWVDYSATILGAASKSDEEAFKIQDTPLSCLKILVRVETSDATNALDAWLKRWY